MDIDHDGVVSYNEFLETFRLAQSAEAEQGEHRQQEAGNENENEAANEAAPALQNDPTMSTRKLKRSSISESLRSFTSADTIDGNETFYSKEEIIVALSECGESRVLLATHHAPGVFKLLALALFLVPTLVRPCSLPRRLSHFHP